MTPGTFTPEELALLRAAVTIPTCWNPTLRDEALALVEQATQGQLPLPTSIRAMMDGEA
jgi:hypothetical protein